MSSYDELVQEARSLVVSEYRPEEAEAKLLQALELAESKGQRLYCYRHLGVCYQLMHDWAACIEWHNKAFELAKTDVERANVCIDRSQGYRGRGDFEAARQDIAQAIAVFCVANHPDRLAVAFQFLGHILLDEGKPTQAVFFLKMAVAALRSTSARHDELYATLRLSIAYAENGSGVKSRLSALSALNLARNFGSSAHVLRSVLLLTVGNRVRKRVEQRLKKLRSS